MTVAEKAHAAAPTLDRDCWEKIESSIYFLIYTYVPFNPNPTKILPSLVAAGIFRAALTCQPHVDLNAKSTLNDTSTGAVAALELMPPYLYANRIYWAAANRGDLLQFGDLDCSKTPLNIKGERPMKLWRLLAMELERGRHAHQGRVGIPVHMCSNTKLNVETTGLPSKLTCLT